MMIYKTTIRGEFMYNLLVIEDVVDVNAMLCEFFTQAGYNVLSAKDGAEGLSKFQSSNIDFIILDIMLPFLNGEQLLKEIRAKSDVPVLMLSAKDTTSTKIDFLKLGADDYMTKPFDLGELLARVESTLRRVNKSLANTTFTYEHITVDDAQKIVTVHNRAVNLTATEFGLLRVMIEFPKKVFTKANLFESVWNEPYYGEDDLLKTHMSNLRNKLKNATDGEDFIETIRGIGYRLK